MDDIRLDINKKLIHWKGRLVSIQDLNDTKRSMLEKQKAK
jgi:hypothetical protein